MRLPSREFLAMPPTGFGARSENGARKQRARDAHLVLGNVDNEADVPLLDAALTHDEPLVREHAAWALARLRRSADGVSPSAAGGQPLEARVAP